MEAIRGTSWAGHARWIVIGAIVSLACALTAATASAGPATYYASPTGSTSGSCTESAPCTLQAALGKTLSGDVVVALPGTYPLTSTVSVSGGVTLEGQPGQPRPSLVGGPSLDTPVNVAGGGLVRHLDVEVDNTDGKQGIALTLNGGTAEDMVLIAGSSDTGSGEALQVKANVSKGTTVRTVLAVINAPNGKAVSFEDQAPGTINLYNVTAIGAGSGSEAVSDTLTLGTVWFKDSIAHGQGSDVSSAAAGVPINLTYSDFRASNSSGYADQGGNILAPPVFVDTAAGNYREAKTSPTVDAGAAAPALAATDLDGNPRVMGSAPDMGAYEYPGSAGAGASGGAGAGASGGAGGGSGTVVTTLPPSAAPVPGVSVAVRRARGLVRVQLPGRRRSLRLARGASVPVGSIVDVTHGAVLLTSAMTGGGATKTGLFHDGRFMVTQATGPHATTNLRLLGGSFASCSSVPAAADRLMAGIARRRPRPHHVVRQLWGSDSGGSFVTIGNTASAAVRGTLWLTQDRCDGTLVQVLRGAVLVHDDVTGRNIVIHRGHAYLARKPG